VRGLGKPFRHNGLYRRNLSFVQNLGEYCLAAYVEKAKVSGWWVAEKLGLLAARQIG
jgi:hypothetical protein